MDAAVHYQLVKGQAGYLPADRVEGAQKDGVRGVVHHNLHTGSGLQGADVTALTADDAALDLIVLDGEGGYCILDGGFRSGALDGVDHDALGFLGGVQAGFVNAVVDIGLGFRAGFGLHRFYQLGFGLRGTHPRDGLNLADYLGAEPFVFLFLLLQDFLLGGEGGFLGLYLLALPVGLRELLVQVALFLADAVFRIPELGVLFIDGFLVLALEGKVLLLGLENALVLDFLAFDLCLFQDLLPLSLEDAAAEQYVRGQRDDGAGYESDKDAYNIHNIYSVTNKSLFSR